jgi:hypothetical protein
MRARFAGHPQAARQLDDPGGDGDNDTQDSQYTAGTHPAGKAARNQRGDEDRGQEKVRHRLVEAVDQVGDDAVHGSENHGVVLDEQHREHRGDGEAHPGIAPPHRPQRNHAQNRRQQQPARIPPRQYRVDDEPVAENEHRPLHLRMQVARLVGGEVAVDPVGEDARRDGQRRCGQRSDVSRPGGAGKAGFPDQNNEDYKRRQYGVLDVHRRRGKRQQHAAHGALRRWPPVDLHHSRGEGEQYDQAEAAGVEPRSDEVARSAAVVAEEEEDRRQRRGETVAGQPARRPVHGQGGRGEQQRGQPRKQVDGLDAQPGPRRAEP